MPEPIEYPKALYRDHATHAIAKDEAHEAQLREDGYVHFSELDHDNHVANVSESESKTESEADVAVLQARTEHMEEALKRADSAITALSIREQELVAELEKSNATITSQSETIKAMEDEREEGIAGIAKLRDEIAAQAAMIESQNAQIVALTPADTTAKDKAAK